MKRQKSLMISIFLVTVASLASMALAGHHSEKNDKAFIAGLQDPLRPGTDKARDEGRKPRQMIEFFGIKPGMRVLDLIASGGYYTEVLSHRVGKYGEVLSHNNKFMLEVMDGRFAKEMDQRLEKNRLANVSPFHKELGELGLENEIDAAALILNYHDIYSFYPERRIEILQDIRKALKPGGILAVIDMHGVSGDKDAELHRLGREITIADMTKAGFKLEKESQLLRNTDDDHSLFVFHPDIHGKTDRYALKFVK